jgi:hypothetical protein
MSVSDVLAYARQMCPFVTPILNDKHYRKDLPLNDDGRTALQEVSGNGDYEEFVLLLRNGANPTQVNPEGRDALYYASAGLAIVEQVRRNLARVHPIEDIRDAYLTGASKKEENIIKIHVYKTIIRMLEAGGAVREFCEEKMKTFNPVVEIEDLFDKHLPPNAETKRLIASAVRQYDFVLADFDRTDPAGELASLIFSGEEGEVLDGNRTPSDHKMEKLVLLVRGVVAEIEADAGGGRASGAKARPVADAKEEGGKDPASEPTAGPGPSTKKARV